MSLAGFDVAQCTCQEGGHPGSVPARQLTPLFPRVVGSGTGRWVIELARTFPEAQVVGLDIESPPQAVQAIPPNVRFVQVNLLDGLPFADRSFDFTHRRLLAQCLSIHEGPGNDESKQE